MALKEACPDSWIIREVSYDYGIDCEIEIAEDYVATGALLKCQVKGLNTAKKARNLQVQIKATTVRYWLAMPVPVILVRVVVQSKQVLWLNVRQHLLFTERLHVLDTTDNKTISFSFADALELPADLDELRALAFDHQLSVTTMLAQEEQRIQSDFISYHILVLLFDSDPDKWLEWVREQGTDEQLAEAAPFLLSLKQQMAEDPTLIERIIYAVKQGDV